MNRRTLLGRFVFGAAAVLGAGMVAPKAEAAGETLPTLMPGQRWEIAPSRWTATRLVGAWTVSTGPGIASAYDAAPGAYTRYPRAIHTDQDLAQAKADAYNRGIAVAEARAESRLAEGLPLKRGALGKPTSYFVDGDVGLIQDTATPYYYPRLTFEGMQADCAARGCSLKLYEPDDGWQLLTHYPEAVHTQANLEYRGGIAIVYERVDAWRRWVHDGG